MAHPYLAVIGHAFEQLTRRAGNRRTGRSRARRSRVRRSADLQVGGMLGRPQRREI